MLVQINNFEIADMKRAARFGALHANVTSLTVALLIMTLNIIKAPEPASKACHSASAWLDDPCASSSVSLLTTCLVVAHLIFTESLRFSVWWYLDARREQYAKRKRLRTPYVAAYQRMVDAWGPRAFWDVVAAKCLLVFIAGCIFSFPHLLLPLASLYTVGLSYVGYDVMRALEKRFFHI